MKYLIIGGGIAGTTAADELRKREPDAEVTIIDEEHHRLYSRVLIPHYVMKKVEREKVFLKKPEWYEEKSIELFSGVRVESIDLKNKFVATSEGRELPFDKLLITTGTTLHLIDGHKRGISYLRTLDDADHLIDLIGEVLTLPQEERSVAIFGGGFISLEYVNIFAKFGLKISVIQRSRFWSNSLSEASRKVLTDHLKENGIEIFENEIIEEYLGEKELTGVKLASGKEVPAKILGIGIGTSIDKSILEDAGIDCNQGILADEFLSTSFEYVYTAGDVAEFQDVILGKKVKQGNWMSAIMQARCVAVNMTGEKKRFELVSSYAMDVLEKHVVFIGETRRAEADEVVQIDSEKGSALEIFNKDGRTIGAAIIGDVSNRAKITQAIKQKELYVG